jgi:hypothetical protein
MKNRKLFFCATAICFLGNLNAQNTSWSTTVGIGIGTTTVPTTLVTPAPCSLHVTTPGIIPLRLQRFSGSSNQNNFLDVLFTSNPAVGITLNPGSAIFRLDNTSTVNPTNNTTSDMAFMPKSNILGLIIKSDGRVGLNGVTNPITSLQLKGDIMMGNTSNGGKWHLHTQDWMNGDFFIVPDKSDGTDDWGKSVRLERSTGNFFVGDKNSAIKVVVGDAGGVTMGYGTGYVGFNANRNASSTNWNFKSDGANNGAAMMWADVDGKLRFSSFQSSGNTDVTYSDATITSHRSLTIGWVNSFNSGAGGPQITIGKGLSSGPHVNDYTLAVPGKLVAKEIYVTLTGWADYVFDDNYKLMPLDALNEYITNNNHLPNVPTTEEVLTNGNNAGETDRILLEKVEELTLYILQLEKRIKELEKK